MTVNVLVNGFGTIGKRVAHAIQMQDDMQLVGIVNRSINPYIRAFCGEHGPLQGTPVYCSSADKLEEMKAASDGRFAVNGTLEDALSSQNVDVVVDCLPKGIEEQYKPLYKQYGVKMIFQGGADADIAETSFNATVAFDNARLADSARVVSCNTTSLARLLNAIDGFELEEVNAFLVRRAVDPPDDHKGPVDAILPVTHVPSHHGPDVQTVMPHVPIMTMAAKVPVTKDHNHFIAARVRQNVDVEDVYEALRAAQRVLLFNESDGFTSTALIEEYFRDIGRPRGDMYEAAVWNDSIRVENNHIYWTHAVHSEGIVVPENIDAIRALTGAAKTNTASMKQTNANLGIL